MRVHDRRRRGSRDRRDGPDPEAPGLLLVHGIGGAKEDFADHVDASRTRPPGRDVRPPGARRERRPRRPAAYSPRPAGRRHRWPSPTRTTSHDLRLLGHSMGGMVMRRFLLAQPEPRRRRRVHGHLGRAAAGPRPPSSSPLGVRGRAHRRAGGAQAAVRRARPARVGGVPAGAARNAPGSASTPTTSGARSRR